MYTVKACKDRELSFAVRKFCTDIFFLMCFIGNAKMTQKCEPLPCRHNFHNLLICAVATRLARDNDCCKLFIYLY